MGGGFVRGVEDRLFGAYAERMGEESRGGERQPCRRSAGCAGEAEGAGAGNPGTAPGERDLSSKASAYFAMAELDRRPK